jgi:drug/metabolite transporter (DMT)-like permease
MMPSALFGWACLLFFAAAQGVRDAFFGNTFQSVSFFVVAILAFGASTVVFGVWAWLRQPDEVRALVGNTKLFMALNATTAAAWMGYFFALKHIEPAIVNTLYTGVGQIAVLTLSVLGISMAKGTTTGWLERAGYVGVLASLIAIAAVVVLGQSGLSGQPMSIRVAAVIAATAGGIIIAISHMIARRLGDLGIGSNALMGLRFPLTLGIAVIAELAVSQPQMRPEPGALPFLAIAAFGLIVIPSYFLQLGVARTSPLAVNVMRSLGPIFVFAAQQFDGRLSVSGATLSCILAFVFFATLTSTSRGWAEARQR